MSCAQGRPNQRRRTRKALLEAASRLMREGRNPSLEEVAEAALVSRATAYRYFPSIEALLVEATLDVAAPSPEKVLKGAPEDDPVARLERLDAAFEEMMQENEAGLRAMLAKSMEASLSGDRSLPKRQNRRGPLIEAALQPSKKQFKPAGYAALKKALALVIGTEAMIAFKDVLQIRDQDARKVRRWMIKALVEAARK